MIKKYLQLRQTALFFKADPNYGRRLGERLEPSDKYSY